MSAQKLDEVAVQVATLWKVNQIGQLGQYLRKQSTERPDYAPALVAGAFYDYIYLGKMNQAKARLLRLAAVAEANPEVFPETVRGHIAAAIEKLNAEMRLQRSYGRSEAQWQASANAQAVRTATGNNPFPMMTLLMVTPGVTLPPER